MSTPPALTNKDIERLSALRDEVQAGGRSEGEVVDRRERAWLGFWRYLAARGDAPFGDTDWRVEWTCGWADDVVFGVMTDERTGIEYVRATLRECVTAFGLTREQAIRNLDEGARGYIDKLERVPLSDHNRMQLMRMRRYLTARDVCPCGLEPCECELDERIAH